MKINGHELEMKFIYMVSELKKHKEKPYWIDFIWTIKFKRKLRKRLEKLEESYNNGFLDIKAFTIWEKMINEVL